MSIKSNHLVVERVPIDLLKPIEPAVRHHPMKELQKLQRELKRFGQVLPIPVTPDFEIIDLELVWLALKSNGATHVDVVIVEGRTPDEIMALRLALNRIAQDAIWDDQNLKIVFEGLLAVDFDLDLTGFEPPEIDLRLNLDIPQANVEENGRDIPNIEENVVSAPGVIWALDDHRLGCGNATDLGFVTRVLAGRKANVAFVDAPHNIPVDGFISGKGKHRHRELLQGSGEMSIDQYFVLLRDSLQVLKLSCAPDALLFSCIDWRHIKEMAVAGHACGLRLYNICVWTKTNGGMGGIYRNAHEFICVYCVGDEQPLDNVELGRHGRYRTNVWSYPGMSSFGKDRNALLGLHPKPVAMIADALRDVTKRRDIVLDTFLGSGSTLMAAHETGRICCGVELDPRYVDAAVRRWQNATGREAVMAGTGATFNSCIPKALSAPSGNDNGL